MTTTASLPWNTDGQTKTVTSGNDLHARATSLAHAAMEAAALQPVVDVANTAYGRSQATYEASLAEMRSQSARAHVAANNKRAEDAAAVRAARQAEHEARNAAAAQAKQARRIAKAA